MASGELLSIFCPQEEHDWHLIGDFIDKGKVIGTLDFKLGRGSCRLSDMTNMAKQRGLDSWRLICDRCGHTRMSGCFPSQKEV